MAPTPRSSSVGGSVHRAFWLLQAVVAAGEPVGVRELSRRTGIARSTVARLVEVLAELGMVDRTSDGEARPGLGLVTLTTDVDDEPGLWRERGRPVVAELQREFGENAAVGIDTPTGFLYLVGARTSGAVQVSDPTGRSFPQHLVAPGVVAMSSWNTDQLSAYLDGDLDARTPTSVVDPTSIRRRLDAVRADGYAWTNEELDVDVNGLAAPLGDRLIATLYGPAYRLSAERCPDLGRRFADFVEHRAPAIGADHAGG